MLTGLGVAARWKPILIYAKHTRKFPTFGPDVIEGKAETDPLFNWQQSLDTFEKLVKRFTKPGDIILDPFLGAGTTMIAALKNGRSCIGIELLKERIRYTQYRLKKLNLEMKKEGATL